jgi:Response regulators consisting of a CheY-like receiver domain and a winged-helix DNA-binding domain
MGADDYVVKPFGIAELLARSDALCDGICAAPIASRSCGPDRYRSI